MSLPDFIPLQSVPFAHKGDDGEMYVEINWYLFLYNLWLNVLGAGGTPLPPSVQIALTDSDVDGADIAQVYRDIANSGAISGQLEEMLSIDLPGLRQRFDSLSSRDALNSELDGPTIADLQRRIANLESQIPDIPSGPTFTDLSNAVLLATDTPLIDRWPGRLLNVQVLSSSTTYNMTPGTNSQIVELQAPGGGGGGVAATGAGQSAAAGGAGAGAYAKVLIPRAVTGISVTLPIGGAGGAAGANTGATGGAASFGSIISCPGGFGGNAGNATSAAAVTGAGGITAAPTISGATTLVSTPGSGGRVGVVINPGAASYGGGGAAPAIAPAATQDKASSNVGINAPAPGGGGSGANQAAASGSAFAGGNGGNAYCLVWEFA